MILWTCLTVNQGVYNRHIKWYQIRECFLDPQIWICFLFAILNELVNGGVANVSFALLIRKSRLLTNITPTVWEPDH